MSPLEADRRRIHSVVGILARITERRRRIVATEEAVAGPIRTGVLHQCADLVVEDIVGVEAALPAAQ